MSSFEIIEVDHQEQDNLLKMLQQMVRTCFQLIFDQKKCQNKTPKRSIEQKDVTI